MSEAERLIEVVLRLVAIGIIALMVNYFFDKLTQLVPYQ
jgi:hypothetical protein